MANYFQTCCWRRCTFIRIDIISFNRNYFWRSGWNQKDNSWTVKLVKILHSFHAFPYISKRNRNLPFEMHNFFFKKSVLFVGLMFLFFISKGRKPNFTEAVTMKHCKWSSRPSWLCEAFLSKDSARLYRFNTSWHGSHIYCPLLPVVMVVWTCFSVMIQVAK